MKRWIGIDIGGSHVTSILTDNDFNVLKKDHVDLHARDLETVLAAIEKTVTTISVDEAFDGLGMAVPGNVDPTNNTARYLPNFDWANDVCLGTLVIDRLKLSPSCHVTMRNDGRCAAIAEAIFGSGRNSKVFSLLTLGTGIGGSLLINAKLFDGVSFDAGDNQALMFILLTI